MKTDAESAILIAELLDESPNVSLHDLCRRCELPAEIIIKYLEYGVIETSTEDKTSLYFHASSIKRIQKAQRLEQDLGVNRAGAALALDLLDEIKELRARLRQFE